MHGNEPTAALSAALTARGVDHVAVGLSENYGEALRGVKPTRSSSRSAGATITAGKTRGSLH